MLDPFGPAPKALAQLVQPLATKLNLATLPLHIHQVLFFAALYQVVLTVGAPAISRFFVPKQYAAFNARTRLNWNIHIVSMTQCAFVNTFALWVMFFDKERKAMDRDQRLYGYSGSLGLLQAMALGYFLWDLYVCARYLKWLGGGMLAHAISAVTVFSLGFRPFVNFYCPTFILYELSTPFLNIHWFFDKLNMTGSKAQLYNGIALIFTFFCCRLVWGSWQSIAVFSDIYQAMQKPGTMVNIAEEHNATIVASTDPAKEVMRFAYEETIPLWLAGSYLASNLVLNALNWFWFEKMIAAVRKRFSPSKEKTKLEVDADGKGISKENVKAKIANGGAQVLEVDRTELRHRK